MAGIRVYLFGVLAVGTLHSLWAAGPAIGVATTKGTFAVNNAQVSRSAALFEGAVIETGMYASRVELNNGSRIDLNANSRLTVGSGEATLQNGSGEIGPAQGFSLKARSLRVQTEGVEARADVRLAGESAVIVQAVNGPVRVFSRTGVLVAAINPGTGMTFDTSAAPPDDFEMTGCVLKKTGASTFGFVSDNLGFELTGASLAQYAGKTVAVIGTRGTGTPTLQGASAVIQVTKVTPKASGCAPANAKWPGSETMDPAGALHEGMKGSTKAIIAGVGVAGAAGAVAAAAGSKSMSH